MAQRESVAIISGACGDIGRAIALELSRRGAAVGLSDIVAPEAAESLVREVRATGRSARYDRVDVTDAMAVERWVGGVQNEVGDVKWVIASAATVTIAGAMQVTPEQWRRELDINLNGSFFVAKAGATGLLKGKRDGRIVFVGSWAAHAPHANLPAYSVSKAGVRMLCQCMALELAPHGITVNEVAPGYVDAGLSAAVFRENAGAREKAAQRVPIGRMMTAEDVARQVAYLCFDASPHTTGSVLLMDGGLSLGHSVSPATESQT